MFDEEWEYRPHYNSLDDYELDEVAEDLMKENKNDENFDLYEEIKSQPQIRNVLHELINDPFVSRPRNYLSKILE